MSGATENKDGTKKRWLHGSTVVDGEVKFTSVSQLQLAESCLRRWWYRYLAGFKEEDDSASLIRGNDGHSRIAHYLTTGDRSQLNNLVLKGLHQLPPPGPDLLVEYDFVPDLPNGKSGLSQALLRAADIPLVGAIDLMHERPENYGVANIEDTRDEPGVIKVIDHKFPNKMDHALSERELVESTQMSAYGLWAFLRFPHLERVRLSHNYFPVKGTPRAPTVLVTRDDCENTWKGATAVAVSIRDAARETDPDKVDANTNACNAYGRPCPAIQVCKAANFSSLEQWVGTSATREFLASITPDDHVHLPVIQGDPVNPPFSNTPVQPGSLAAFVAQAPTVQSEVQRLTAAIAPPVPVPVQAPTQIAPIAPQPITILDYLNAIEACGFGLPAFGGTAAQQVAQARGQTLGMNAGFAGTGTLGQYTLMDINQLPGALTEARAMQARQAPVTAPAVTPAVVIPSVLPPDAPAPNLAALAPMPSHSPEAATTEKPKRGRPKKDKAPETNPPVAPGAIAGAGSHDPAPAVVGTPAPAPSVTDNVSIGVPQLPVEVAPAPTAAPVNDNRINLYVDCNVDGAETRSLWPEVEKITSWMTHDSGCGDFREASGDNKYAFGKWKGVLAGCVRKMHSASALAPGSYTFDVGTSEVGAVVAETMREIVRSTGGVYVTRGLR